jgi:hypothetical protein
VLHVCIYMLLLKPLTLTFTLSLLLYVLVFPFSPPPAFSPMVSLPSRSTSWWGCYPFNGAFLLLASSTDTSERELLLFPSISHRCMFVSVYIVSLFPLPASLYHIAILSIVCATLVQVLMHCVCSSVYVCRTHYIHVNIHTP